MANHKSKLAQQQESAMAIIRAAQPITADAIFDHASFAAVRTTRHDLGRALTGMTMRKLVKTTAKGYVPKTGPVHAAPKLKRRGKRKLRSTRKREVAVMPRQSPAVVAAVGELRAGENDIGIEIAPGSRFAFIVRGVRIHVSTSH